MSAPEFSRMVKARRLPADALVIEAGEAERAALAQRFGIVAIEALRADARLDPDKDAVVARGTLTADIVQTCAVSGEDFGVHIEEPLDLRFIPSAVRAAREEIELEADDPDEIEFTGESFDLGEAAAQSLALAIDPYAEGPDADRIRKEAGLLEEGARGPLAEALAALKKD